MKYSSLYNSTKELKLHMKEREGGRERILKCFEITYNDKNIFRKKYVENCYNRIEYLICDRLI